MKLPETAAVSPENATPWAWRSGVGEEVIAPLGEEFFRRPTTEVARKLLGCRLRSVVDEEVVEGVVVETEAYSGPHDPASHAAARIGRTARNESMFGPPGYAYVYRIYGVHWCLNAVTGKEGFPAAVLIRALDPLAGIEYMVGRRGGKKPLCAGPGRLTQALAVDGSLDGHSFQREPLQFLSGWDVPDENVGTSGRIGVRHASNWPHRFFLRGHPELSR